MAICRSSWQLSLLLRTPSVDEEGNTMSGGTDDPLSLLYIGSSPTFNYDPDSPGRIVKTYDVDICRKSGDMPPRKRLKVSPAPAPQPTATDSSPNKGEEDLLNDAWTDEEELGLLKGLIKYKPTGIHKHFRLLALHEYLLSNGFIQPRNEHTKLPGIWKKLATLYDLEALDQREDARQLSDLSVDGNEDDEEEDDDDVYSLAANKIHKEDFQLPDAEFGELKWQQRFATDEEREKRQESPLAIPEVNLADMPPTRFTASFSIEPSDAPSPLSITGKKKVVRRGRKKNAVPVGRTTRSARQAQSVVEEDGDEGNGNNEEEEKEDDDEEDEDEAEDEDNGAEDSDSESESEEEVASEKEDTPARSTRAGRGGGRSRGRPARTRGTGRKRGRNVGIPPPSQGITQALRVSSTTEKFASWVWFMPVSKPSWTVAHHL
nr:chromatin modification-related protein eaf7 [Quercus suber]